MKIPLTLFILSVLCVIFICPLHMSAGQNLNVGELPTVRMIYFLPNDWLYRPKVVQEMKDSIRTAQNFFAEQMQAHGEGKKTFRFETDRQGAPRVRLVNGKSPFSHYDNTAGDAVIEELEQAFDFGANIYFIVLGAGKLPYLRNGGGSGRGGRRGKIGGLVIVPDQFTWGTVAHELGHAFGLHHDFRDDSYIMSYGARQDPSLSAAAAEYLAVSPFFNPRIPTAFMSPPTVELISSPTYAAGSKSIPLRFKVEDSSGLHQILLDRISPGAHVVTGELQKSRGLAGKTEAVVEFEYEGGVTFSHVNSKGSFTDFVSLSDAAIHHVGVRVIDTSGNISVSIFRLWEQSHPDADDAPQEPKVVSITDANLAKAVRKALGLKNKGPITKQDMLKLDVLDARNSQIKNLTGLEHAKQLTRLRLDRNQIRDLNPLSGLTRLKTLTLDENQISNIGPLTKLTQLDWLLIGGNPIKNAGVRLIAGFKQLRGLSLYDSQISNITPLAKLTKLESLWLDYNQIRDVSPLAGLTNLRTLYLRENQIRDISPIGKLTQLTSLRLADNPIADVGLLASLRRLEDVDIEIPPAAPSLADFAPPPDVTSLFGNYPNPFNPETWIPYQLASPADVSITIYAADGALVRTLDLGHQSGGHYDSGSRAAYWDGKNEVGEPVASGVYFYTLTAGEFTATRKMLIRK
ncbi:MAG: leucine-rich repeat domain-containing protein [Candidatus Poribacteria bacterium]|nr:leucine-rich repeat domain-containing protein [Candidatus Poribacteria bacterium]